MTTHKEDKTVRCEQQAREIENWKSQLIQGVPLLQLTARLIYSAHIALPMPRHSWVISSTSTPQGSMAMGNQVLEKVMTDPKAGGLLG